jgi:hypothetical protein
MPPTIAETSDDGDNGGRGMLRIPRHEQDEDLYRNEIPGRDPVTQIRGSG